MSLLKNDHFVKTKMANGRHLRYNKSEKTIEPLNQSSSSLLHGSTPNFKIISYLKNYLFAATKMTNGRHLGFSKSQLTFKRLNQSSSNSLQAFILKFKTHC